METSPRDPLAFGKTVAAGVSDRNVTFMAAGIAYQAFISLLPLLVLVFFLVSIVGDEGLAEQVTTTAEGFLPQTGRELLEEAIAGSVATTGASAIGIVTLVWGSLKIFRGLDTAFSEIYDTTAENSLLSQLRDGLVVLVALVVGLLAAGIATVVFALFPAIPYLGLLNPLLLVGALCVAFFPMYYVFPDLELSVREVLPGVVVAAIGWAALQALFQVYVAFSSSSDSAGAIGAILLLLTWLYFGGLVLLIGAVINATVAGRIPTAEESSDVEDSIAEIEDRDRRERDRLDDRIAKLERERDRLRNDLDAQRERRYLLEDRTDRLEEESDRLERENARLRAELHRRRRPPWRRLVDAVFAHVTTLNVLTVRERGE